MSVNVKNGKPNPNQNSQANHNMQQKAYYYNQNNTNNINNNNQMVNSGIPPKDPKLSSNSKIERSGRINNFEETDANNNSIR